MNTTENGGIMGKTGAADDGGLQCLITIAAYYGIVADAEGMAHSLNLCGRKMTAQDILLASKKIELKSRLVRVNAYALSKITVPAILVMKNGDFMILARQEGERLLLLNPFEKTPRVMECGEMENVWGGDVILLIPRSRQKRDAKFGFKWFLPSILRDYPKVCANL